MGRFNYNDADHYGGQGGAGYFKLQNDKDVARVRFMYDSIDDVEGFAVHEVKVNDKKRWVNCLRDYNEPVDKCPFCSAKKYQNAKLFIPLYNIDEDKVQIWERGKKFFGQISSLCARYPHLVSHEFEIERNGKKGETSTTYGIFEVNHDETTLDDLPERPDVLGSVVLDKSAEDMGFYLDNGYFPPEDEDDMPVRRRSTRDDVDDEELPFNRGEERRSARRTPANNRERF